MHILSRFKQVKTFAFDMDGVLTDGNIMVNDNNNWLRSMNIRDGYALQMAVKEGFRVVIISGSDSAFVRDRLNRLGIHEVYMKINKKEDFLKNFLSENNLLSEELLFMGDDIPDYYCMKIAGLPTCPSDAAVEIKEIASYISPLGAGGGCVRDVIEKVLKLNNKWPLKNDIPST